MGFALEGRTVLDTANLFGMALGLQEPWYVRAVDFDAAAKKLTLRVDFREGSHFPHPAVEGLHPVYDTEKKTLRHLNVFQHECYLEVRIPRVQLPDGKPRLAEPDWVGKLDGFTLLFEAFVLVFCRAMTFSAAARIFGISEHRTKAICHKYVNEVVEQADYSKVHAVAIDETSRARGMHMSPWWQILNDGLSSLLRRGRTPKPSKLLHQTFPLIRAILVQLSRSPWTCRRPS